MTCIEKDGFIKVICGHYCVNHKRKRISNFSETLFFTGRSSRITDVILWGGRFKIKSIYSLRS